MPEIAPEIEQDLDHNTDAAEMMVRQVAHALLNPLTAVVGYAELLAASSGNCDPGTVHRLHAEAMRAFETSKRVLTFAKTGSPLTPDQQVHSMCMSMRHQINNPLTGILGLAEMGLATPGLPPKIARRFEQILQMAEQIRKVLRSTEDL